MSAQKLILQESDTEKFAKKISDLDGMPDAEVLYHHVVVAKYIRNKVGSILIPDKAQKEDQYQSKMGVVIKVGPAAFHSDSSFDFHGVSVAPGEWVMYRMSDGWDFDYTPPGETTAIPCRMLEDSHLKMRIKNPERIY